MMSLVVVNPEDSSQTFEYGKKGRKPLWVQKGEREGLWSPPQKVVEEAVPVKPSGSLRIWKWRGPADEGSKIRCFMISESPLRVLKESADYFVNSVSGSELGAFWREIDEDLSDCFPLSES